jgi:glycosyltransferase involved in cell wall biosynthesis
MALAAAGHDVRLLARNEERAPRKEREDWMEVRRLPAFPGAIVNRIANFPYFFNPLWIHQILHHARGWADAIVVEDLPLAPTALWVGRLLRVPVYYDMGEVYPEYLRGLWDIRSPTLVDRFVRNPHAADVLERYVLPRAEHVFVVSDESRNRALRRGAHEDRISIVGNTPEDPESLVRPQPTPADLQLLEGRPIILFTGILIFDRGIIDAVRAVAIARREIPDLAFVVVGDGPDAEQIRREVELHDLDEHVYLLGWKEHATLPAYYQRAHAGLLPFLDGGQIRFTLANKLFDYMGAGLPVIASDVPPMRRIVDETGAGILVPPGQPEALAEAVIRLLRLPAQDRELMAARGKAAVAEKYNWRVDSRRFVYAIEGGCGRDS